MNRYLSEIFEQPEILAQVPSAFTPAVSEQLSSVEQKLARGLFDRVVLTGMGASLFGAYPAFQYLSKGLSVPVAVVDCSELVRHIPGMVGGRTLLIVISQSGRSGEILDLVNRSWRPAMAIAVTNLPGNPLSAWADISIHTRAGEERTVSTKTYTAGLAALHIVVGHLVGQKTEAAAREVRAVASAAGRVLEATLSSVRELSLFLEPCSALTFVGSGPSHATAQVGALVTQEAAKRPCMSFTAGQFWHGPIEMVDEAFAGVLVANATWARDCERALVTKTTDLGGRWLIVGANYGYSARQRSLPLPDAS